jgi:hypothetical protein
MAFNDRFSLAPYFPWRSRAGEQCFENLIFFPSQKRPEKKIPAAKAVLSPPACFGARSRVPFSAPSRKSLRGFLALAFSSLLFASLSFVEFLLKFLTSC